MKPAHAIYILGKFEFLPKMNTHLEADDVFAGLQLLLAEFALIRIGLLYSDHRSIETELLGLSAELVQSGLDLGKILSFDQIDSLKK